MTTDIDIYRAAKMMIDKHGDAAATEAAGCAGEIFNRGDNEGGRVWLSIRDAITVMQNRQRDERSLH